MYFKFHFHCIYDDVRFYSFYFFLPIKIIWFWNNENFIFDKLFDDWIKEFGMKFFILKKKKKKKKIKKKKKKKKKKKVYGVKNWLMKIKWIEVH